MSFLSAHIPDSRNPALANHRPSVLQRIASSVTTTSRRTFPREKSGRHARAHYRLHGFFGKFSSLDRGLTIVQRDAGDAFRLPMATLREYSHRRLGRYLRSVDSNSSSWRRLPGMSNGTVASLPRLIMRFFRRYPDAGELGEN